jgi:hypothetical protein
VEPNAVRLGRRQLLRGAGGLAVAAGGAALAVPVLGTRAEAQQSPTTTGGSSGTAGGGSGTSTSASGATTTIAPTTSAAPTTTTTLPPVTPQPADIAIMSFANSVELALVALYGQALGTGQLGADNAKFVGRFQNHHRDHAQSFAGMGGKAITNITNQSLVSTYSARIQAASSEQAVLLVLLELETAAASSYTAALADLIATNPAYLVASILPTEARHAVVIGQKLSAVATAYLPSFESTAAAFTPAQYPIVES